MALRGRMKLASYDRLFPSQDLLPSGGVGNLIAAPLFKPARDEGRTVFLDQGTLEPYAGPVCLPVVAGPDEPARSRPRRQQRLRRPDSDCRQGSGTPAGELSNITRTSLTSLSGMWATPG
jgi:hypothetical protein